jgi:hypothetical protein
MQREKEATSKRRFDAMMLEYKELGSLLRFERTLIDLRLRRYTTAVLVLLIAAGYPLGAILSSDGASGKGLIENFALVRLYGALLITLCVVVMVLGDGAVRKYGEYRKRRTRITLSRRTLRGQLLPSELTAMPIREPVDGERPDPGLSSFQRHLPLWFGAWSMTQVLLLTYALGLVLGGSLQLDSLTVRRAILLTAAVLPVWSWVASKGCLRYKALLAEARMISTAQPYPRFEVKPSDSVFWVIVYASLWMGAVGCGMTTWYATEGDAAWWHCGVAAGLAALWSAVRVLQVLVAANAVRPAGS